MIERGLDNKLTPDSRAATVIRGMSKSELSHKLTLLEESYYGWLGIEPNDDGLVVRRSWYTGIRHWMLHRLVRVPSEIFRLEISLLAQEVATRQTEDKTRAQVADFYRHYCEMNERQSELRRFLVENFEQEVRDAEPSNTPLLLLVQQILVKLLRRTR